MNHFTVAQLLAGRTTPMFAEASNPDAQLIRLCDRFVEIEEQEAALFDAIKDDTRRDVVAAPLRLEWQKILDWLEERDAPATLDGAKALARAALATSPKDRDGEMEVGHDPEDWLLICVAKFVIGVAA